MSKSPRDTNGPTIKTGPTAGNNRSRNKDGSWRRKRSDAGKSRKKGGCFLTTAACEYMGRPDDCYELTTLRAFRDNVLLETEEGRRLVSRYYDIAPSIVSKIDSENDLDFVWLVILKCVRLIENGKYTEAIHDYKNMVSALEKQYF